MSCLYGFEKRKSDSNIVKLRVSLYTVVSVC